MRGWLRRGFAGTVVACALLAPVPPAQVRASPAVVGAATGSSADGFVTQAVSAEADVEAMQARLDRLTHEVVPLVRRYDMGVAIVDNRSGRTWAYRGEKRNNMASLTKVSTAVAVFLTADRQGRSVTAQERAWMRRSLRVSDNPAQQALWRRIGGHPGYARAMKQMGLSARTRPVSGRGWGRTISTPRDQVRLMTMLLDGEPPLKAADAAWIVATMRGVHATQMWGSAPFGRAEGRTVAVKNGWSPYPDTNRWRLTSLGHVSDPRHDYTIAIMSNGWRSASAGVPKLNAVGDEVYSILGY